MPFLIKYSCAHVLKSKLLTIAATPMIVTKECCPFPLCYWNRYFVCTIIRVVSIFTNGVPI